MKITSRNLLIFSIVLFIGIAGLICGIIFSTPDPQSDVVVSYQRPVSFDPVKSTRFNATPVVTASPSPTATKSLVETDIATATPTPSGRWVLAIQDPLGDPIPSGSIAFGSESLSFTNGSLIVPATAPRELIVRVSAEGYTPGEFTITPGSSPLVLDYLCDFSIRVEDERGNPSPNTAIRVWKSNPPPRPVRDQATLYIKDQTQLFATTGNSFRLMRDKENCRVAWVGKTNHWYEVVGSSRGEVYPQTGDWIVALGTCAWQAGYAPLYVNREKIPPGGEFYPLAIRRSCRLRIWDSLCLAELPDANQGYSFGFPQILEILRENQIHYYYQNFPKCAEDRPSLYEEKTDEKGEWRLRGVPPALYYVQAIGGENRYSNILPLHPACGGTRLRLWGEGSLWVYVELEGVPAKEKQFARVPGAEITLQSQTGIQLYGDKTDETGEARIARLPYGKYRLKVTAQGKTVEKNVTINKSMDTCTVKLPQDEFYTITGIVLEQDSGAPVAGYALELNADREGFFGYHVYHETTSDANGRFEFHDVIPGQYCLSEEIKSLGELEYIFSDPSESYGFFFESNTRFGNIRLEVNEDIHDVKILVKPVVKTSFSGIVVDQKGIPAANAVFAVSVLLDGRYFGTGRMKLHPEDFKTGVDGLFSLTIYDSHRTEKDFFDFEITAMIGSMAPSRWTPSIDEPGRSDWIKEQFHASSIGSVTLAGDMGDTFTDLRIVLEPQITDKSLQGKLAAEGENQFSPVYITATQKNQDVFIQHNDDGYFKVENISAGDITLDINPGIRASIDTPYGPQEYNKYLNRSVTIRIEDGHPQTYVEIPLPRAGYYWGTVKDGDGNPLPDVDVWAEDKPGPGGHHVFLTNQNGFFFIDLLGWGEDKRYNVKYRIGEQIKTMPDVPIDAGNLLLQ